jgi:2-methylcitrate dehydratase PrpD
VIEEPAIQALLPRIQLQANPVFDSATPLSSARVSVTLRDGTVLTRSADGARGYPGRLSLDDLAAKFMSCAHRTLTPRAAAAAWSALQEIDDMTSVRQLSTLLAL